MILMVIKNQHKKKPWMLNKLFFADKDRKNKKTTHVFQALKTKIKIKKINSLTFKVD